MGGGGVEHGRGWILYAQFKGDFIHDFISYFESSPRSSDIFLFLNLQQVTPKTTEDEFWIPGPMAPLTSFGTGASISYGLTTTPVHHRTCLDQEGNWV